MMINTKEVVKDTETIGLVSLNLNSRLTVDKVREVPRINIDDVVDLSSTRSGTGVSVCSVSPFIIEIL